MNSFLEKNLHEFAVRYPGVQLPRQDLKDLGAQSDDAAPRLIKQTDPHGPQVYLIQGLRSLSTMNWLKARMGEKDSVFLVVERETIHFTNLCQQADLSPIIQNKNCFFIFAKTVPEFASQLMAAFNNKRRAALIPYLTVVRESHLEASDVSFFDACDIQYGHLQQVLTSMAGHRVDGLTGLRYFVENLPWVERTPGIDRLRGVFKGASAIVASTGPSLSKSLDLMRELQSSHIILAADASLKILLKAGIQPHFVCTMERELSSKPFFDGIAEPETKAHLVAFPEVPSAVIQAYGGPHWISYRKQLAHLYFEQQSPRGILSCGHSVAHLCMQLAAWMGCERIGLVGQDLAFDPDSLSSHSENVAYAQWSKASSEEELKKRLEQEGDSLIWVPGNLRERLPSRGYYLIFAWEFAAQASQLKTQVTNCTEGGMKIPHLGWKRLSEWSADSRETKEILKKIDSLHEPRPQATIDMAPLLKGIQNWIVHLQSQAQILWALASSGFQMDAMSRSFVAPALELLERSRSDHIIEAFALDILGREVIPLETKLFRLSSLESFGTQDAKLLADYFHLLGSALSDVRTVLTQKVK